MPVNTRLIRVSNNIAAKQAAWSLILLANSLSSSVKDFERVAPYEILAFSLINKEPEA